MHVLKILFTDNPCNSSRIHKVIGLCVPFSGMDCLLICTVSYTNNNCTEIPHKGTLVQDRKCTN